MLVDELLSTCRPESVDVAIVLMQSLEVESVVDVDRVILPFRFFVQFYTIYAIYNRNSTVGTVTTQSDKIFSRLRTIPVNRLILSQQCAKETIFLQFGRILSYIMHSCITNYISA